MKSLKLSPYQYESTEEDNSHNNSDGSCGFGSRRGRSGGSGSSRGRRSTNLEALKIIKSSVLLLSQPLILQAASPPVFPQRKIYTRFLSFNVTSQLFLHHKGGESPPSLTSSCIAPP